MEFACSSIELGAIHGASRGAQEFGWMAEKENAHATQLHVTPGGSPDFPVISTARESRKPCPLRLPFLLCQLSRLGALLLRPVEKGSGAWSAWWGQKLWEGQGELWKTVWETGVVVPAQLGNS